MNFILLDGRRASGLDQRFALIGGTGDAFCISGYLTLGCELLAHFLRASTYSDFNCASSRTARLYPGSA